MYTNIVKQVSESLPNYLGSSPSRFDIHASANLEDT